MTVGQVVVTVALLAQMYGVDPAVLDCIAYRESGYRVEAVNGIHVGVMQWNPDTLAWLGEKANTDPLWLHRDVEGPVYRMALAAWAVSEGYGSHWSTWTICGGEG